METLKRIMIPILLLSQTAWTVDGQIQGVNWTNNLADLLTKTGLPEDLPFGTKLGVLSISGYPADVGHPTFSTNSSYFNVNETTGEVILNKELSYRNEPQFGVTFFARDDRQGFGIQTAVTVNVRGVNHAPYFDVPSYQVSVKDNVPNGTTFYNLIYFSDIDKDTEQNGTVALSCVPITDQDACQTFTLSYSKAAGKDYSYLGSVSTNALLNYNNKPKYTLLLVVKDDGDPPLSATATLTINIESQFQRQPIFLNTPITLNVNERIPSTADLGSVQAKSGDSSASNPAPLGFQITEDAKHWFYLESTTYDALLKMYSARIRTFGNISRAALLSDQYSFEITAAELSNGQPTRVASVTIVQVKVNGTNTFAPTFSPNSSVVNILEGLSVGAVIPGFAVRVNDPDQGDNGFFTIQVTRVTPSPVPDIFLVQPTSAQSSAAVYLTVNKPEYLSYDDPNKRQYQLVITARESKTDQQNSGTTSVTINVLSRYNSPPVFTRSAYLASLVDNRPIGTTVTDQIQANDPNGGDAGRITYAIVAGNQNSYFNISRSQATIVLAKTLTYAATGQYAVLTIMAQDGTGLNATATLRIEIIDSTHQGPVFNPPFIYTTVLEGNVDLRPPIQFLASPLQRDRVVMYRIIGGNADLFTLTTNPPSDASKQPTGTITMNRGVDYNDTPNRSGVFQLVVQADSGGTDPLTTNLTVNVYVEDTNNHPPVFNQTNYSSVVTEVSPPETRLLTINATDLDQPNTDNSKIHYIISGGSRDNFVVDYTTGVIRIASHPNLTIDRYGDQYNITVLAIDEGSPPNTATATVYIKVTDSVYRPPVFSPQTFTFYVNENTTRNTVIGSTPAWSPDRRAVISYSIIPGSITAINKNSQPVTSSNMTFNYNTSFAMISNSSIFVNGPLSYEYFVRTDFQVKAVVTNSDNGTIPPAIANVTIFIVRPVQNVDTVTYLDPAIGSVYISIYNTLPVGTQLYQLIAFYPQTNTLISRYSYTAVLPASAGYINVNDRTGLITLAQYLERQGLTFPVNFTYNVIASADPPSTASAFATVVLNVKDINAEIPVFSQRRYDFTIYNNATQGNFVGKISATIPGSPQSPVTYEFLGNNSDAFSIDNRTGEIRVNNAATANSLLVAVLTGQAYFENSPKTQVVVYINVIHFYNSNPPVFRLPSYTFYTLDKTPVNSVIGQVNAYNPDIYYNSTITYTAPSGNGTEYFQIDRVTGSIQTKKNLLFSPDPYILNVTATSSGVPMRTSFAIVRIIVANVSSGSEVGFYTPKSDMETVYAYVNCLNCPVVNIKGYSTRTQPILTFSLSTPGYDGPGNVTLNPTTDQTETILKTNGTLKLDVVRRWQTVCLTLTDNSAPSILAATRCINVTFVSSQPPGFDICPWYNGSALQANVSEHMDAGTYVTTVVACSPEQPPEDTNMIYNITGGNDPVDCYGKSPFTIDPVSGNITTEVVLKWNCTRSFTLNVTVSYRNGTKAVNGSTRQVVITIDPTDSNGPTFDGLLPGSCRGVGTEVTDGILDFTPPGTVFIQMYAGDCDAPQFGKHNYTFDPNGITFYVPGDSVSVQNVPNAFVIDISTGDIATNLPNYRQYSRGYFQMTVVATDDKKRSATAKLTVFIVREGQRIKFVFGKTPSDLKPVAQDFVDGTNNFLSQYNAYLKAYGVVLSTHIDKSAYYYFNETDMCFEVIRQGDMPEVLPAMEAIRLFPPDSNSGWNRTMTDLYTKYGVIGGPQVCYVKTTTHWWSGYWFLWWFLIALALFIFVIALILNILACCFWPMYTRGYLKSRPYIVLDEPPVTSPVSDFEWQESMHRIN